MRSSARGSRCCSRNILLNTSLEDGHGGSVRPNSPSRVIFPPVSNDRFGSGGKRGEGEGLPSTNFKVFVESIGFNRQGRYIS